MKRAFDISVAALGGLVLLPMLLILAGLIWMQMGRPILFRQERPGRSGKPFMMAKFRTMKNLRVPRQRSIDRLAGQMGIKSRAIAEEKYDVKK